MPLLYACDKFCLTRSRQLGVLRHRGNMCNCILPGKCRINIKFPVKLKKSPTKVHLVQILTEAYGDETLSRVQVFEWCKRFSGERVSGEDEEPAGPPRSAITDQKIHKIRDMSGFPLISMIRVLINTTAVKYKKDFVKKLGTIDRVTAKIQETFQQLQNLAQKYAFLRPEVILSMDELNLDQAPQDIDKEFQCECVHLQAFVAALEPGCKKELSRSGSLSLIKILMSSNLKMSYQHCYNVEDFLTSAISNASCERSFSKLKLIKNHLRSSMPTLRLINLAILAIEYDIVTSYASFL
ncbi:hypothetical protein TNCV_3949241 [Trichonephila clavipes]|nr:hypothetical protein TNCV_3949241 [Trichonephila clavipes]